MSIQKKFHINTKLIYSYFFIVLTFFVAGFVLNEDSSGGGRLDFIHEYKSFLEFKSGIIKALTSLSYESSRTPLFLILNSFNIFADNEYSFRLTNFIFNFFIILSFYFCLKFQKIYNHNLSLLIVCIFLFSPYFRSSSYWAHQENLPFLFYFLALTFYNLWKSTIDQNLLSKVFIIAFLSSLSFYSDQKFIFVSFSTFLFLILKFNFEINKSLKVFGIYFITSLPAFYLFYIWGGILPKESQFRIGFYRENISSSFSIVAFYFLPIVLMYFRNIFNNKTILKFNRIDFIVFFLFLIINLLTIPNFDSSWGQGVIYKLFYIFKFKLIINNLVIIFLYLTFLQLIIFTIYILLKNNLLNFLPITIIILISSFVERTYNEYFDPLILVLIFTFFRFNENFKINQKQLIVFYSFFYFSFLVFANLYYKYFNLNVI